MAGYGHVTQAPCAQLGRELTAADLTWTDNGRQDQPEYLTYTVTDRPRPPVDRQPGRQQSDHALPAREPVAGHATRTPPQSGHVRPGSRCPHPGLPRMSFSPRPWRPEDFTERCETCGAPPGQLCEPSCDTGYTAEDSRHDAERRAQAAAAPPGCPRPGAPTSRCTTPAASCAAGPCATGCATGRRSCAVELRRGWLRSRVSDLSCAELFGALRRRLSRPGRLPSAHRCPGPVTERHPIARTSPLRGIVRRVRGPAARARLTHGRGQGLGRPWRPTPVDLPAAQHPPYQGLHPPHSAASAAEPGGYAQALVGAWPSGSIDASVSHRPACSIHGNEART
jgi:hypothetical protein